MKFERRYLYSFVAPFMILLSILGLLSNKNNNRFFYLPIGLMGVVIISEKSVVWTLKRRDILNKIKSYKKNK